jgi:hypothetical protein
MLRAGTDAGAPNYAVLVSPGAGIKVQVRATPGGATKKLANPTGTRPAYLKVVRAGNTFTAYTSGDGATIALAMASTAASGAAWSGPNPWRSARYEASL